MGRLIGRGGATIKELRQRSGARIDIGEEGDRETDVHLHGTDEQRREAERLVNSQLGYSNAYHDASAPEDDTPIDWGQIKEQHERAQREKWAKCPELIKAFYKEHPEVSGKRMQ